MGHLKLQELTVPNHAKTASADLTPEEAAGGALLKGMIGSMRMKKRLEMYGSKDFGDRSKRSNEKAGENDPFNRSSLNDSAVNMLQFEKGEEELLNKEIELG